MKRILGACLGLAIFLTLAIGQNGPAKPSPAEEREANALAARFFNRLRETKDVTPLIRQYFVSDFPRRLLFCRTTRECEGFARDFWKGPEDQENSIKAAPNDYLRQYAASINYFYLYMQAQAYARVRPKSTNGSTVSSKLKKMLRHEPRVLRWDFFANPDAPLVKPVSIKQFRQHLAEFEKLNAALRVIESEAQAVLRKHHPKTRSSVFPNDFKAMVEENNGRFFNYPVGTKMIDVWPNENLPLPFKMDLIKEKGQLKIIATYPPVD